MAEQKAKKSTAGKKESSPITFSVSDIKELFILMKENDIAELNIEQGETKIHIVGSRASAVQAAAVSPVVPVVSSLPPVGMVAPATQPAVAAAPVAAASSPSDAAGTIETALPTAESETLPSNVKTINSPMVGTFYRAPAPDAPPFVDVGDRVKEDTTLCIIEAMKLMNEIKAEMRGKVVKILVENGMPVEYGQPLFLIEPE
ncbi:MAG: acetyl-CoA carboxylase biotin carboxyl carrier protein [Candidatus Sumerlaeaceae bacterium]